jgi:membrane protease YdiL (CAAX protease family)
MKSFVRNLTPRGEAVLVVAICFGLGITALRIARHLMPGAPQHGQFSNLGQVGVIIYELSVFALVFLCIGRIRGWSLASLGFQISWKWTGLGVLLFVAAELIFVLAGMIAMMIVSHFPGSHRHPVPSTAGLLAGPMALPIIIIVSIINGIFEELMEVGYTIKATEKYGMWSAVFISALIRAVLHVQLGSVVMASVLVIGGMFGLIYWKSRQLWPLIVAHILADIFGLLMLAHHAA